MKIALIGTVYYSLNLSGLNLFKNIKVNYLETRNEDIRESICDNKKIKLSLGFKEFIKFEESISNL